jgi:DNA-nicking Smr family endonuclease
MTARKKTKSKGGKETSPAKRADEGYRPFAALKNLKVDGGGGGPAARSSPSKSAPPRRSSPPSTRPQVPSSPDDETLTLHRMMSGVTPLGTAARRIPRTADSLPTSQLDERRARAEVDAAEEAESVHLHLRALIEGGRFEVEDDGRRVEGRRAGVSPDVVRKLRRGLFSVDAKLDLHGMRAEEARDAMERFLREKRARGERCVLVVHGKGDHSPGRQGVLRGEIAAWLSQGAASVHVEAFSTAQPEDGGEGAAYVLLVR